MRKTILLIILLAGLIAVAAPVEASLTFNYDTEYSGGSAPASQTTPWLSAIFTDTGENKVTLTLTALSLTSTEFVSKWVFNLDPAFGGLISPTSDPGYLTITNTDGVVPKSISIKENGENAGSGLDFDIQIEFYEANSKRFKMGSTSTFDITFNPGVDDFDASSFNFKTAAGDKAPDGLYSAAHIQGINNAYSGWVSGDPTSSLVPAMVPIPGAVWLLGSGLLGLLGFRRRQKK